MNIDHFGVPALCAAAAILLFAAVASAQESSPPAQTGAGSDETAEPAVEAKKIVAVARFEDRDGSMKDDAILSTLDTMLWSTFAGRKQSRYRVVRLEPAPPGCGLKCALEAAKAAGATYLVRGDTQWVADGLLATIEIVSVQTGAQLHSRRSEHVLEADFLVESTAEAISRAADHVFQIQDAQTVARPPKVTRPIIAVAHLENAGPALHPELFSMLDDAMYTAIAGIGQTRYQIGRLAVQDDRCDLECAVAVAKAAGATYVLWSAVEREADQMRIAATLASTSTGASIRAPRSVWVTEFRLLKLGVDQVSREIAGMLIRSSTPAVQQYGAASNPGTGDNADDVARAMAAYRQKTLESPAYTQARSNRNTGVALFVIGFVLDSVGVGLIGAGQPVGNQALVISGYVIGGVGTIMFFTGLGVWVSNQIRMNKLERGIPLGRSLRLDGLAPIVASRDSGAPGLSARSSF